MERATITRYVRWLEETRGLRFDDYAALWQWSVDDLEAFWSSIWEFGEVKARSGYERVLGRREMPGAEWFPGARLNYAEHIFAAGAGPSAALVARSETRDDVTLSWDELRAQVARAGGGPARARRGTGRPRRRLSAQRSRDGDRLSRRRIIGAVWSSAAPEFGARSVIDRFARSSQKCSSPSTATATAARTSTASRSSRTSRGDAHPPATVVLPYLDPGSATSAATSEPAATP